MTSVRQRFASTLERLGVIRAVLAARSLRLLPWRWLTILTYHRVTDPQTALDPEVVDATPEEFDRQVAFLAQHFDLVDTSDLEASRRGLAPLPDNPAMITFDDGYRDNHDVALPILRKHGAKATFFVATSYVADRRLFWWDRIHYVLARSECAALLLDYPRALALSLADPGARKRAVRRALRIVKDQPGLDLDKFLAHLSDRAGVPLDRDEERRLADKIVMTWDEVRALSAAGMDVQSHSHSHRILGTQTPEETRLDLERSRDELFAHVGIRPRAFAYPAGRGTLAGPGLRRAVADAGFSLGFTCGTGIDRVEVEGERMDWLEIPRVSMEARMSDAYFRSWLALPMLSQ